MQVSAMSSAMVGMRQASTLMDHSAAQIALDGPVNVTVNSSTPASAWPLDQMVTAVPNLLIAAELFKFSAFVARVAEDSYQASLAFYRPAS